MGSVPTLNYDMISNILNIRMNQKRKDRIEAHKKIYGPVVQNMINILLNVLLNQFKKKMKQSRDHICRGKKNGLEINLY